MSAAGLALSVGAALVACSSAGDVGTVGGSSSEDSTPENELSSSSIAASASTPTTSGVCEVPPGASGPLEDLGFGLPDPGSYDWPEVGGEDTVARPDDWLPTDLHNFDFDGDGENDQFIVDQDAGVAGVRSAAGDVVVSGLNLDAVRFVATPTGPDPYITETVPGQTVPEPEPDPDAVAAAEPRTPEAITQANNGLPYITADGDKVSVGQLPVAVHDVTGDGVLDLLVGHVDQVGVVVGQSEADATSVPFDQIESQGAGWVSPPVFVEAPDRPGEYSDGISIPSSSGSFHQLWDFDGDGAQDFMYQSYLERTVGPVAYYTGKPCQT
jgi:hypothetical protein